MAAVYRFWVNLLTLAVLVQIGLAGVGAFHAAKTVEDNKTISEDSFASWFDPHAGFGYILVLAALVLVILAAVGRRARLKRSLLVLGLFVLQVLLAWLAFGVPALGWLHPLNALAILATVGMLARDEWRVPAGEVPRATAAAT